MPLRARPSIRLTLSAFAAVFAVFAVGSACSSGAERCASSADCAGGQRCESGRCVVPAPEVDAGPGADAGEDAGAADAGADGGARADAGEDGGADAGMDAGEVDAGYCVTDAGNPPNRLFNAGFECGVPPDGWVPIGAQLAVVSALAYDGAQSARLMSLDGGAMSLFPTTPPVSGGAGIGTWCASGYVNGTVGKTVRISLQAYGLGGGLNETTFSQPLGGGWERIEVSAKTTATDDKVTMRVWMPSVAKGEQLLIDDVQLWSSANGTCNER